MFFGREKEIQKLLLNMQRGIHTLAFGAPGAGKTAILLEAASKLSTDQLRVVYVGNCGSRRDLVEGALASLRKRNVRTQGIPIQDLRDVLLKTCREKRLCLVLDHLPIKLHHRMQRLLEMLETCCTLVFSVPAKPDSYDLYYWKFSAIEIKHLPRKVGLAWIDSILRGMAYVDPLKKAISHEIFRLTMGNPGAISRTLATIGNQPCPLDDPIRIRRMFVDSTIRMNLGG
jgi:hypothetical protein